MNREKQILLNEKRLKQKPKKFPIKIPKLKNIINKKRKAKSSKEIKSPKIFNIIIASATLIILFLSLILIIRKSFLITKYNINHYKNKIPIAFALNANYVYPIIVTLTSILYNSSPDTFYIFYLLLNPDIKESHINKILGIKEKYPNCKIELIKMGEKYSDYPEGFNKSASIYYRLELSELISDFDKIIYLDGDTIVHKDLTDMYNINMGKYYYMGFPDHDIVYYDFEGKRNFINSGVLLINLKDLREINATKKFKDYYDEYGTLKVDEYLINAVFYGNISFLPFIYGIPDFGAGSPTTVSISNFISEFGQYVNWSLTDMEKYSKNRAITHMCYENDKWWEKNYTNLTEIGKQWLFYASKSNIFDDICKKYHQFESQCEKIKNEN